MSKINITQNKNLRYERKFAIRGIDKEEIELRLKLHPAMFSEMYHERQVNTLYLDTMEKENYFESVIGLSERVKIRIRWYGNLLGFIEHPVLELKIKNNMLGTKLSFPLKSFNIDKNFSSEVIHQSILKSNLPEWLKEEIKPLRAIIITSYTRKYLESQ